MGLIPESVIEEVLARADIVDTVRHYVNIKKAGKSFKGICPFHDDHDPSLKIHPGKQIYKCFACGAGGNAIGFVMEIEGWSFPEAVRTLAERHGVEIPDEDPEAARRARKRRDKKQQYYETMEAAGDFYENNLWSDRGRAAQMYLDERGIDEETAREFGLGYAPDGWEHLLGHLSREGIDGQQAEEAGLALARKTSPGHYDRFRHRIVFPVVDIWRNIRAFGGRTLSEEDDVPKYMNSPETDFYTKGEHLYGLHVAKKHFQQTDYALVVEGNFDVIALHAWGFRTAVAPMGTALTERQAELLSRYARTVIVAFDGDSAGAEATQRCIPALQAAGLEGKVIRFDELDDPDSFVRREGSEVLEEKIQQAQPMIGWAVDEVLVEDGAAVEEKVASLERAADEPLELAPAETSLLSVLLENPEWVDHFLDGDYDIMLASEPLAVLLRKIDEHYQDHEELKAALLVEQIDQPRLRQTVLDALDTEADEETDDLTFYKDCIRSIQRNYAERGLRLIEDRMEALNFQQDRDKLEKLNSQWRKFRDLKNESVGTPPRNR